VLRRPDRVPRFGRARAHHGRRFRVRSAHDRFLAVRWVIVGIWAALLVARIVIVARDPDTDLAVFGAIEFGAVLLGLAVIGLGIRHAWVLRNRREDDALGLAVKRIDPTVWLLPAVPTDELRTMVSEARPGVVLGRRVTWAFGATEASLWELDDRKATRVLVIRWSRVMHVGIEDVRVGRRVVPAIVLHYVRSDDRTAVAAFFVRRAPGASAMLGRGPRLERLVMDLATERIVA
jgi:hypothetical protein